MLSIKPLAVLTACGVILNALGVITVFLFAMPFRVRKEGEAILWRTQNVPETRQDKRYDARSRLGLALILIGCALQIAGVII
jgi:hypothetical protein